MSDCVKEFDRIARQEHCSWLEWAKLAEAAVGEVNQLRAENERLTLLLKKAQEERQIWMDNFNRVTGQQDD